MISLKQKISFLLIITIGLLHNTASAMFAQITYPLDQEEAKKTTFFKDGVSFAEMEQSARLKHSNIPPILLVNTITDPVSKQDLGVDAAFESETKSIWASRTTAHIHNSNAFEWAMLHETGHAQMPYVIPCIIKAQLVTNCLTGYYWGAHRAKPYRNSLTKFGSKYFAAVAVGAILNVTAMKVEERRADNWANKNADAKVLQGGIEYFDNFKKIQQDEWSKNKIASIVPFSISKYFIDPLHPSIDSRIAKCQKALKDRFGLDA